MGLRVPQSVALRVALKAYLSTDHVSAATGKTLAVVISKNMGAFGNPSAGATNATEVSAGWYFVDLSTTDTATLGPLVVRATASGVDDVEPPPFEVAKATNAGFTGVPDAVAAAAGGLPTFGTGSGQINLSGGRADADLLRWIGTAPLALTSQLVQSQANQLGSQAKTDVNTEVVDTLAVDTYAEPSAAPAFPMTLTTMARWITARLLHKQITSSTAGTDVLRNAADGATVASTTFTDAAGVFTRGKYT